MSEIEAGQNDKDNRKPSICSSWRSSKNCGIRFGIMMVIFGLIWLGVRMGFLPVEWFHSELFWPMMVVLAGSWIIVKSVIRRQHHCKSC